MKTFTTIRNELTEKMRVPKPPIKGMNIVGFKGKLKLNQESGHEDNHSNAVIKDFKTAVKIVDKHLKKLGMKSVPEIFVGPKDIAQENRVKVGAFDMDFAINLYPGFKDGPKLPSGKSEDDINLDDMVNELARLKSFCNFPRSDWSANYGGR